GPPMPQIHPRRDRARSAVLTALILLPVLCTALTLAADRLLPDWHDHEQAVAMGRLRARVAESPGRPLELILGSSRALNGIDAGGMSADPSAPVVVNMSLTGSNPMISL